MSKGNNHTANGSLNFCHSSIFMPAYTPIAMATKNWVAMPAYLNKNLLLLLSFLLIYYDSHFRFKFHDIGAHMALAIEAYRGFNEQFGGMDITAHSSVAL